MKIRKKNPNFNKQ